MFIPRGHRDVSVWPELYGIFFSICLTLFYLGMESIYSVLFMENISTTSVDGLIHGHNGEWKVEWCCLDLIRHSVGP